MFKHLFIFCFLKIQYIQSTPLCLMLDKWKHWLSGSHLNSPAKSPIFYSIYLLIAGFPDNNQLVMWKSNPFPQEHILPVKWINRHLTSQAKAALSAWSELLLKSLSDLRSIALWVIHLMSLVALWVEATFCNQVNCFVSYAPIDHYGVITLIIA